MGGVARVSMVRTSALPRLIWGATLLAAPRPVLRVLGGRQTALAEAVLRVLGARHLVQAMAIALYPSRVVLAGGAGLDGLHVLTALALAAVDPSQIRIALTDASIAATWIGLDVRVALRPTASMRGRAGRRRGYAFRMQPVVHPVIRRISARSPG
jgi:hypothetical protein